MDGYKLRWVLSPLEDTPDGPMPVCREWMQEWRAYHQAGKAFVQGYMNVHQIQAARADKRLIVLDSLHSDNPVHDDVIAHHANQGAKKGMKLRELLLQLATIDPVYEPEY